MRTDKDMMELILSKAKTDGRIRAVVMNGSRANPNAKEDFFRDFDIVYIVRDIDTFISDHSWVDVFGERIMMQMPEAKVLPPALNTGHFIYLMWFKDGNRIDLTLMPIEKMEELMQPDSLSILLLDKDGIIGELPESSDKDYLIKKPPTEQEFLDSCNEFWWICMNISKGLWREELPYVMFMYEQINRNVLIQMIKWYIGVKTDFTKSAGNIGKYIEDFLEEDEWEAFKSTYSDADYENIWEALFKMCDLYREVALKVAGHLDFVYNLEEDQNVMEHLRHIRNLPKDAKKMY